MIEIVEDRKMMGIREVVRVNSLQSCIKHCGTCSGLVHYPDNVCVIFNHYKRIVLSSFGATCCSAVNGKMQMKCVHCDGANSDQTAVEGLTNILNVWTRNPVTNSTYKIIPYDCQQTPITYEEQCEQESGHLASIHSAEDDAFISGLAIRSCVCKHIGLYSTSSDNKVFYWRDGTPVDYINWKKDEPYGKGPLCAYIWKKNGWMSGKCNNTNECCAVCQKT
ncbi:unnamed protein product [Thelazia callipaeda]|uniref:C-type lectin domain-containing protein n=1 Tax=Thelazia callipaeda TaxID=103827 RepID=A0A0N5CSN0_THECL|nr:unnamed protein product [Thelazia callipaeda]